MEMIAKISKGSLMDQVYLPKQRPLGLRAGVYVRILPIEAKEKPRYYFRNCKELEPWKMQIVDAAFSLIRTENALITGSFLEAGHDFEDIDLILIGKERQLAQRLQQNIGTPFHVVALDYRTLQMGIQSDPLFQAMTGKFIAKHPIPPTIFAEKNIIRYRQLDLHLLKSKVLFDSFEYLTGREKYKLLRNVIAISLFLEGKEVTLKTIDQEIHMRFGQGTVKKLRENMLQKQPFLKTFKVFYSQLSEKILQGAQHEQK